MESPASALRRHRSEVRRLLRVGFTHYARLKTAHAAWRDTGRGTCGFPFVTHRRAAHRWCNTHRPNARRPPRVVPWTFHRPFRSRLASCRRRTDRLSRVSPDVITAVANAALVRDTSCSHPLPGGVGLIPNLQNRLRGKRLANLQSALRRALAANHDGTTTHENETHGSSYGYAEAARCAAVVYAVRETNAVVVELECLLSGAMKDENERASENEAEKKTPRGSKLSGQGSVDALDSNEPVFECLPAHHLLALLKQALVAYQEDIEVKRCLLRLLAAGAKRALGISGDGDGDEFRDESRDEVGDDTDEPGLDMNHETLTTVVATWILCPGINQEEREEFDAIVRAETK